MRPLLALLLALLPLAAPAGAADESLLFAPGTCPVAPTEPVADPARLPDALIGALLDWIAAETAYDVAAVAADPPAVTFCAAGQAIPYEDMELLVGRDVFGLYDRARGRIVLRLPWSAGDARDRGVLLHELIHRVQMANRDWPCPNAPEWEAYRLHARYLEAHGLAADFDWDHIRQLSRCPAGAARP